MCYKKKILKRFTKCISLFLNAICKFSYRSVVIFDVFIKIAQFLKLHFSKYFKSKTYYTLKKKIKSKILQFYIAKVEVILFD